MTGQWFSPGTAISSTNKADLHDITEILLKVALSIINLNPIYNEKQIFMIHRPQNENPFQNIFFPRNNFSTIKVLLDVGLALMSLLTEP